MQVQDLIQFYTWQNLLFVAAGALLAWCKLGDKQVAVYGLGKVWDKLGVSGRKRDIFELISFILMGWLVGIGFTQPINVYQAFAAGLGWTGFVSAAKNP